MRILLIDTNSVRSGERAKATALADLGHQVTLLAPESFVENYQLVRTAPEPGAPYRLVLGSMRGKPPNRCLFTNGLGEALRGRPDAVICLADENFWLTSQALCMRQLMAPRAMFLCHSWQNLNFDWQEHPQPSRLLYALDTALERRVFRRAAAIMVRNQEAMGVLRRRGYLGRLRHIPWGIDAERFAPRKHEPGRPYTIGFVGRLIADKGVDDLIAASRLMRNPHRLLLVGGGPLAGHIESMGLDNLEMVPVVDHRDMPAMYGRMDVLALPSRSGRYWKEQFGRALAEAMACGVAVAGSSSGAIPEVIGEAGRVFPEGDPAAFAQTLDELADPALRRELAQKGRERCLARFSWQAWARATSGFLAELAQKGRAS